VDLSRNPSRNASRVLPIPPRGRAREADVRQRLREAPHARQPRKTVFACARSFATIEVWSSLSGREVFPRAFLFLISDHSAGSRRLGKSISHDGYRLLFAAASGREQHPHVSFTFLGFTFRPRKARSTQDRLFTSLWLGANRRGSILVLMLNWQRLRFGSTFALTTTSPWCHVAMSSSV
jgi:hypothetical protein